MKNSSLSNLLPLILAVVGATLLSASTTSLIIDDFSYQTDEEARSFWEAGYGFPEVAIGEKEGEHYMEAPLSYQSSQSRHYWDKSVSLDLSPHKRFTMDVEIPCFDYIQSFTLYFHCSSSESWAFINHEIKSIGRQEWVFHKEEFSYHTEDFDWGSIDRIRFSPWKFQDGDSYLRFYQFLGLSPEISIVHQADSANPEIARDTAERIDALLSEITWDAKIINSSDVEKGRLDGAKVAFYPYNDNISEKEIEALQDFIEEGGHIIAFYLLCDELASILGIKNTGWQEDPNGWFHSYIFDDEEIIGLPKRVEQNSWNIRHAEPERDDSRVIAFWEDAGGERQDYPAWLISNTGAFMTHIVLDHDVPNTRQALIGIMGELHPSLWKEKMEIALEESGKIACYENYEQAVSHIEKLASSSPQKEKVLDHLEEADGLRDSAATLQEEERYDEAIQTASLSREYLLEAYYYAQTGKSEEFRGIWESEGTGIKPGDWHYSTRHLRQKGFNAIIPIFAWGATAHYPSKYLDSSEKVKEFGDLLEQAVAAAQKEDLAIHPRKINWWDRNPCPDWLDTMREEGRLQKSVHGEESNWLCPSHPENRELELNTMLEMVENYEIDGIHLDYIRYENDRFCYCEGCRQRFEEQLGQTIDNFPEDCYSGAYEEEYNSWRIENISSIVRDLSEEARAIDPDILISAAVFSDFQSARKNIAQDWISWCKKGYLDFVCPMNYTVNLHHFDRLLQKQKEEVGEKVPVYPGIKGYDITADRVIPQIINARQHNLEGFVLFNYAPFAVENILPYLEKGILKDPVSEVQDYGYFK